MYIGREMDGRILFYNEQTGQGKLMLPSGEKMDFSAEYWSDFNAVPKTGLQVEFLLEGGVAQDIKAASVNETEQDKPQEPEVKATNIKAGSSTFTVEETLFNYFKPIGFLIGEPPEIVNTTHQLDYLLARRFLVTAYNDLKSVDSSIYNNDDIKRRIEELQQMYRAYMEVKDRIDAPRLAFELIFLRSQPEYLQFIRYKEHCLSRLSILSQQEESLFPDIKQKEDQFKKMSIDDENRDALEKEIKGMRRNYVDAIHENANISKELMTMTDVKTSYVDKYFDGFVDQLLLKGGEHLQTMGKILNYRAYDFDKLIWQGAKKSKSIREYFNSGGIEGKYSTLTFLQYYLNTLDRDKLSHEHKDLFVLQEYLQEREQAQEEESLCKRN